MKPLDPLPSRLTGKSDSGALLDLLNATHRDQLALCTMLEGIADSLPNTIDRCTCITAARALGPLIAKAHDLEEHMIFPAVRERWAASSDIAATIERLEFEHMEDICYSEELFDALMAYGKGDERPSPEAFGYMLRGFFESLRRHIAFEQDVIVPLFKLRAVSEVRVL